MARSSAMGLLVLLAAASPAPADDSLETFFELKVRPVLATECLLVPRRQEDEQRPVGRGTRGDCSRAATAGRRSWRATRTESLLIQAIRQITRRGEDAAEEAAIGRDRGRPRPMDRRRRGLAVVTHGAGPRRQPSRPRRDTGRSSRSRPSRRRPTRPAGPTARSTGSSPPAAARPACGPCARADRRTLIRRVTFDLIGLPPTPEEIDAFLADRAARRLRPGRRPPARLAALRRALGPPLDGRRPLRRHGRRQRRLSRPGGRPLPRLHHRRLQRATSRTTSSSASNSPATSWRARSPASEYAESVVATGFLALSRRYATGPYELWHLTLEDAIETTGRAFLGLTLRCARCHDHKFDPVTQRDYYALYGIFASTTLPLCRLGGVRSRRSSRG